MKTLQRMVIVAAVLVVTMAGSGRAYAQEPQPGWFAGLGLGHLKAEFQPLYTYYEGGTPDKYTNTAKGLEGELFVGRRFLVADRFSIAVQGTGAVNGFEWSLSIPDEPASLEYSLPYRLALSLAPEVHVGRIALSVDIGGGLSRVRQVKTQSSYSTYDVDRMRPTFNVGAGVRIAASPSFDVYGHVSHMRVSAFEFDSLNGAGSRVEHITDRPRGTGFTFGVIRRF